MNYLVVLLVLAQGIHGWRNHHQRKHLEFLITSTKGKNIDATEQWFTQILDHTNPDDNRTWLQVSKCLVFNLVLHKTLLLVCLSPALLR